MWYEGASLEEISRQEDMPTAVTLSNWKDEDCWEEKAQKLTAKAERKYVQETVDRLSRLHDRYFQISENVQAEFMKRLARTRGKRIVGDNGAIHEIPGEDLTDLEAQRWMIAIDKIQNQVRLSRGESTENTQSEIIHKIDAIPIDDLHGILRYIKGESIETEVEKEKFDKDGNFVE